MITDREAVGTMGYRGAVGFEGWATGKGRVTTYRLGEAEPVTWFEGCA